MNKNIKKILKERIAIYPWELDGDAVGLWQIIQDRKYFKLSDDDFKQYLHDVIISLMRKRVVTVVASKGDYDWDEINTFGKEAEEVANNISAKWSRNGEGKKNSIFNLSGGVWFARPVPNEMNVKLIDAPPKTISTKLTEKNSIIKKLLSVINLKK